MFGTFISYGTHSFILISLVMSISGNGNDCSLNRKKEINRISVWEGWVGSIGSYLGFIRKIEITMRVLHALL